MKARAYTLYSVMSPVLEQAAVVAIVLWGLPQIGITIPLWGLIILMVVWGICSYVFYIKGRKALLRRPVTSPEDLIGNRGNAIEPLTPQGYIRINNELWKAKSMGTDVDTGEEIVVERVNGLTLIVSPLNKDNESAKR